MDLEILGAFSGSPSLVSSRVSLTPREVLSGISGSISLAAWIILLIPQLVENYKQGSAEGISLLFLTVWFVGDLANLSGAVWAGLVPTVIALAIYFCFADLVLITQCLYYNFINKEKTDRRVSTVSDNAAEDLEEPLLNRRSSENFGLPGSRRRSSASHHRRSSYGSTLQRGEDTLAEVPEVPEEKQPILGAWFKNTLSILLISAAGTAGWAIAFKTGAWSPTPIDSNDDATEIALGAQLLGYLSAICYLGARLPQIYKNWQEKSCEGLSLLFFLLSLTGNGTYGAGILFHSSQRRYLIINLPWLIGSLGTMIEDAVIFMQFHKYRQDESSRTTAIAT